MDVKRVYGGLAIPGGKREENEEPRRTNASAIDPVSRDSAIVHGVGHACTEAWRASFYFPIVTFLLASAVLSFVH